MPHTFCEAAPEGRLGVRQLAAAFAFSLAILTHPKAQASLRTPRASPPLKKYAALGGTPALPGRKILFLFEFKVDGEGETADYGAAVLELGFETPELHGIYDGFGQHFVAVDDIGFHHLSIFINQ
jgi:hypothetical protein